MVESFYGVFETEQDAIKALRQYMTDKKAIYQKQIDVVARGLPKDSENKFMRASFVATYEDYTHDVDKSVDDMLKSAAKRGLVSMKKTDNGEIRIHCQFLTGE